MTDFKKISIIICTYNRCALLEDVLDSFVSQSSDLSHYEVIIVNNNCTDNTRQTVKNFTDKYHNFRMVVEAQQGLSHARNRGCKEAAYDWVAYIDDDARAFPDYVERILYVIDNYSFDCFGGVYLPWFKNTKPKWYRNEYQTNSQVKSEIGELKPNEYFSGGNCVFRKDLLISSNGFHPEIGMRGKTKAYGEETLIINNLRVAGYKIGFDPKLKVEHYVGKDKQRVLWFFKSSYAKGRDSWISCRDKVVLINIVKSFANIVILPFVKTPSAFLNLFNKGYYLQNFIIDIFTPSAYALGQFFKGAKLLIKS